MSIGSSISSSVISKLALDSWHLNLALAKENRVDLEVYEDSVSNTVTAYLNSAPSNISNESSGIIPIVFHLVMDENIESEHGYKLISPSSTNIDFDVTRILRDLNGVYRTAGVTFAPILRNPDDKELISPGINIIDGYNLYKQGRTPNTKVHYRDSGALVRTSVYRRDETENPISIYGYSIEDLYREFSFKNVLNIFLVNHLGFVGDNQFSTLLDAPNPFVFDHTSTYQTYNITLPFYALGNSWQSSEEPGYGYKYTTNTKAQKFVLDILQNTSMSPTNTYSLIAYYGGHSHKAKPLVKAIGYCLGLADLNTFNLKDLELNNNSTQDLPYEVCNTSCVYSRYMEKNTCYSCDIDTYVNIHYYPYDGAKACSKKGTLQGDIYHNAMSSYILPSPKLDNYTLTPLQILRIKANLEMRYIDPQTSVTEAGILRSLLNSVSLIYVIDNEPTTPHDCDNKPRTVLDKIVRDKISYLNFYSDNREDEAIVFAKKINAIQEIANRFI
jgi:hypothetical protein